MMSVVIASHAGPLTRADLDALRPEEGAERYELLDGAVLVTPAPGRWHQTAVLELAILLRAAVPDDLSVKIAPFDVVLAADTVLQPDLIVARKQDLTDTQLHAAPLLTVEVLSPSTRRIDLLLKRDRYAAARIPHYWLIDPAGPSVTVLEMSDGAYAEVLVAERDERLSVERPFPVTFSPAVLLQE